MRFYPQSLDNRKNTDKEFVDLGPAAPNELLPTAVGIVARSHNPLR